MTTTTTTDILVPTRWLPLVRGIWLVFAFLFLGIFIAGLGPRYAELGEVCTTEPCIVMALNSLEVDLLHRMGLNLQFYASLQIALEIYLILIFSALALLIFILRSDTWIGSIVSLAFLFIAVVFFGEESRMLTRLYPQFQQFNDLLSSLSVILFILVFCLFPDGRFVPRWMGWAVLALFVVVLLDPLILKTQVRGASASIVVVAGFIVGATLGVISQVYRYRKVSNPTQRQQTKWVVLGLLCMFSMTMVWAVFMEVSSLGHGAFRLAFYFSLVPQYILVSLFPLSVVISIQRYRLWDVDLIIRRTLQYGLLSGFLALVYFGGVAVLQAFLTRIGGQSSPVVIVLTTLLVAALFNPLRIRIQTFIDRRFYRQKYDAEKALAEFAALARSETDQSHLTGRLLEVVQETIQPRQISLWLKPIVRPTGATPGQQENIR